MQPPLLLMVFVATVLASGLLGYAHHRRAQIHLSGEFAVALLSFSFFCTYLINKLVDAIARGTVRTRWDVYYFSAEPGQAVAALLFLFSFSCLVLYVSSRVLFLRNRRDKSWH